MGSMTSMFISFAILWPVTAILVRPNCSNISNDVCNTSLSPSERAAALSLAATVEEKVANLVNNGTGIPRLNIPAYEWWNEGLHGLGFSEGVDFGVNLSVGVIPSGEPFTWATSFANPILLAAAFDDAMIQRVAEIISTEARAFNNFGRAGLDLWTPNINPYKDPRWGRGMETPGEDPLRVKNYVKSFVLGLEGPPGSYPKKAIATCKHFAGYDLENGNSSNRHSFDAIISTQDLVEYYLPPFQQCARDSRAGSVMCSYNAVNGTPACADSYLLNTILRGHWNWTAEDQYIVTDCGVLLDTYSAHNYTHTAPEAAAALLKAGSDNLCSASSSDISTAYNTSLLSESDVDRAFRRQTEGLIRLGYFDPPENSPWHDLSWDDVGGSETEEFARRSAADSMVLLKNQDSLPLSVGDTPSLALIGFWANATWELLGTYFGVSPFYHSALFAAQQLGFETHYAQGAPLAYNASLDSLGESIEAATKADVVLYFGGIDLSIESEENDREAISWSTPQLTEIEHICALDKPCIVIQFGDQLDNTPLLSNPNVSAILWAGYPGQDGGPAVFDVLTGKVPPAGRLPVSQYPADYVERVSMTDMSLRPSNSSPGRTYKFFNGAVQPFGYGLHYSNFSASFRSLSIQGRDVADFRQDSGPTFQVADSVSRCPETYLDLCPFGTITIDVVNEGDITSDFVLLIFLAGEHGPAPYPIKELVAYHRLRDITPGEHQSASLELTLGLLARVDDHGNTILYPGSYDLLLDVPTQASTSFLLSGDEAVLDFWPQP
ncbi:glycoside hydrolase superfamily [Nemania abortiva]|nr:glycoside hydrolase superfamily [Nemania abortiva]